MESFNLHGKNESDFTSQDGLITKKGISDEEKLKIKHQDFSGLHSEEGNAYNFDNYSNNFSQQNVVIDLAQRNLDKIDGEHNKLNQKKVQEELADFAREAREVLPVLEEQLKYQADKLKELAPFVKSAEDRVNRLENSSLELKGTANPNLGNKSEFLEAAENSLENLSENYDRMADLVEKIRSKIMYLKYMGYDVPEVEPKDN